ncbi:MAG: sensor histidine kinase [Bacteroidetes bacterium]|nr:sensor histidine kinase [Bacteroidota bacterium]
MFAFISFHSFSQNQNLDSLRVAVKHAEGKSKISTLLELGWNYRFINADSARKYGFLALELARKNNIEDYEAEALNTIGVTHEAQGNYEEAMTYELKALEIRKRLGNALKIANTLNTLGIIHDEKGDYPKALAYYFDARKIYESLKEENKIAMVLTNIGIVLRAQKEYKNVVTYYRQAMRIYQKLGNKFGLAACHSNLGAVYLNIPNYDSAIYYSLLASKEFEEQNIRQFLPTTLSNSAIAFDRSGQYEKSRKYFLQAKKFHEEYRNQKELSFTLSQLARLESKLGNHTVAVHNAEEALAMATKIKAKEQIMQAHEALAEVQARMQNFKNAYAEHVLFMEAKDSLFQKDKAKSLQELQTKYETEKHKQEIALLNQENELKSTVIERNYLVIGGLVLVLVLLGMGFYLWRVRSIHRQRAIAQEQKERLREAQINAVIESQEQERKRFAADLHDGMGQLVAALQLNIQSIKNKNDQEKTISLVENSEQLLQEIQQEIRNTAFNLMPPILGKEGLIPAVGELIRRITKGSTIKAEFTAHDVASRFPDVIEISVYRIIQEIVSNILKHGNASHLIISFTGFESEVVLTIEDDGVGFDLSRFQNSRQSNGWRTIETRMNLIKGAIEYDTMEGRKNNSVVIRIPNATCEPANTPTQNQNTES